MIDVQGYEVGIFQVNSMGSGDEVRQGIIMSRNIQVLPGYPQAITLTITYVQWLEQYIQFLLDLITLW